MLETAIIEEQSDLEALSGEWRELLARAEHPEPVQTPLWLLTWWRVFGDERRKLRVFAVWDEGRLIGMVPLLSRRVMEKRIVPFSRLELLASGEDEEDEICSDYIGPIVEHGREWGVAEALSVALTEHRLGTWDELVMPAMSGDRTIVQQLDTALRGGGAQVAIDACGSCPYIALPKTWDAYLKSLDRHQRYGINRALRDLEDWAGPSGYELRRADDPRSLDEGYRVLVELHEELWKEKGQRGVFSSTRFARFHREVMRELAEGRDGELDLMWLTVKGQPIAAVYNIVYRKKTYVYQSGRKTDVPRGIRPGILIHALAIQRAIAHGQREYDFLNGEALYKRQLTNTAHPLVALRAVAPSLRARALETARVAASEVATRLREARKSRAA